MHLNTTCPVPAGAENYGVRGTAWKPILWSALACTLATIGITLSLITLHLRRYRVPKEQRQIIRLAFCVVIYAIVAFFEVYSYEVAQYIDPIGDLYEAFGLWYVQEDCSSRFLANKRVVRSTCCSFNMLPHPGLLTRQHSQLSRRLRRVRRPSTGPGYLMSSCFNTPSSRPSA